jgi:hypothetical protein
MSALDDSVAEIRALAAQINLCADNPSATCDLAAQLKTAVDKLAAAVDAGKGGQASAPTSQANPSTLT